MPTRLILLLFSSFLLQAQSFEVASVKPTSTPDQRGGDFQFLPGGKLTVRNVTLLYIVCSAYDLPFQSPQLTGDKAWQDAGRERYDIDAAAAPGAIPNGLTTRARDAMIRTMLQGLLAERFQLQLRRETKEQAVYLLEVAKDGPKLKTAEVREEDCVKPQSGCHRPQGGQGRGIHGAALSVGDMALFVQNWTDKPVVDRTRLAGLYHVETEGWMPMRPRLPNPDGTIPPGEAGIADSDRQTLFDVFKQLGLRMVPGRAPIEKFIVEHVERLRAN